MAFADAALNTIYSQLSSGCWLDGSCSAPVAVGCASGVFALGFGITAYLLSLITGNDSWVDRSWSIVPVFFAWFYVIYQGDFVVVTTAQGSRTVTSLGSMAIAITIWGVRLTYNFYRRGGYERGGEDYRWEHVRSWPCWRRRWLWQLFSFGFISLFQEWLLWAITTPLIQLKPNDAATPMTLVATAAVLIFIVVETIADQQQWSFQNEKRNLKPRRKDLEDDYAAGFLTHGLFAVSRHPNVWAEQHVWLSVYAASVPAWGLLNGSVFGALTLVALTLRSCALTEELSSAKYPLYRKYQLAVPVLVPANSLTRRRIDDIVFKEHNHVRVIN